MKIRLWIGCAAGILLLNELMGMLLGVQLGIVSVGILTVILARALCKKYLPGNAGGESESREMSGGEFPQPQPEALVRGCWTCPQCGVVHEPASSTCEKCGTERGEAVPEDGSGMHVRPGLRTLSFYSDDEGQEENPPRIRLYFSSLDAEVSVARSSFTLGRDESSHLNLAQLPNASYIGRHQASIACNGTQWYIRDEGSGNGTLLNGQRLEPLRSYFLELGDFISFADRETLIVQHLTV